MDPKLISINDYNYSLPEDKIAVYPLKERDQSKLLIYKNGEIKEGIYKNISHHLPGNSLLIFNNTKVIPARILFKKDTGSVIEIFCLEPSEESNDFASVHNNRDSVKWKCMIGGAAKWKSGLLEKRFFIGTQEIMLSATLKQKLPDTYLIEFSWKPFHFTFAEVLECTGEIPLPPYIKRNSTSEDKERYQTIYARQDGSVAAPTAGLHFTPKIFFSLKDKNISTEFITLHVGAGTFKPVKSETIGNHEMHGEWIDVSLQSIENILNHFKNIIAVGTTSLRTLESLYWMGVKATIEENINHGEIEIKQWDAYKSSLAEQNISTSAALLSLIKWMRKNNLERLITRTQILIAPGYSFKIAKALITNFHQPRSTLLLLVAAAIGNDWKKMYEYALQNDFRFLSYGDGSLIFIT